MSTRPASTASSANPKRHLAYSFWVYSTGIYEIVKALCVSMKNSHKLLKLTEAEDSVVLSLLNDTMNLAYPNPANELDPKFINKFFNACHRLFGIPPPGPDQTVFTEYIKPEVSANGFFNAFESALTEIALCIQELNITADVRLGNYYTVAEHLNNLKSLLTNNTYNEVEYIAKYSAYCFGQLLALLDTDDLMVKRLQIRAEDRFDRLKELGQLVGKPAAQNARQIHGLALKMEIFCLQVETIDWTQQIIQTKIEDPLQRQFYIELINDLGIVKAINLFELAAQRRARK